MIVYNKLGYQIKELKKENGIEVFEYMHSYSINKTLDGKERYEQRLRLKAKINEALNSEKHVALGVYNSGSIIGICFTNMTKRYSKIIKISYIHIDDNKMKTNASSVLFNFMINILYDGMRVTFRNGLLSKFKNISRKYPSQIGFSGFKDKFIIELKKFFKDK